MSRRGSDSIAKHVRQHERKGRGLPRNSWEINRERNAKTGFKYNWKNNGGSSPTMSGLWPVLRREQQGLIKT